MEQIAGGFAGLALAWGIIAIFTASKENWREARTWVVVTLIAILCCIGAFAIDFVLYVSEHGA